MPQPLRTWPAAEQLIRAADMPQVRQWTESLWGKNSPYVCKRNIPDAPPVLNKGLRIPVRMPNAAEKRLIHQRDGFLCRCGDNSLENTILTCAPCNFGKMNYTLEELGLVDPRGREGIHGGWDGLERLLTGSGLCG